jgi:NAD/NADP transhydrogenase beta subunit
VTPTWVQLTYLACAVCFILALKGLSGPKTARTGNLIGAAAAVVAWQLGEFLGAGPTEADLERVGAVVTTPVRLSALPALSAAPFSAVLAYIVGALVTRSDDLGRPGPPPGAAGHEPDAAEPRPAGEESVDAGARG